MSVCRWLLKRALVNVRRAADQPIAVAFRHRPFDHRWLRQQSCDGGIATVPLFVARWKFAESRAGAIEQHLPTKRFAPALEPGALDTTVL